MENYIEISIKELLNEFKSNPFNFYNERDAQARFFEIIKQKQNLKFIIGSKVFTAFHLDFPIKIIKNNQAKRRSFDLAVMNEKYFKDLKHSEDFVKKLENLDFGYFKNKFQSIIELKLLYAAPGREKEIEKDLIDLCEVLSSGVCEKAYFIYFQRMFTKKSPSWRKSLEQIEKLSKSNSNLKTFIAIFTDDPKTKAEIEVINQDFISSELNILSC
jgi:hypothetical protein